jgi:hypothetical protein
MAHIILIVCEHMEDPVGVELLSCMGMYSSVHHYYSLKAQPCQAEISKSICSTPTSIPLVKLNTKSRRYRKQRPSNPFQP